MLVVAAVVVALSGGGRAGPARVAIEAGVPGRPVPTSFLGMSMEWPSVEPFAGAARPEPLIAELAAAGAALVSVAPLRTTLEDVFMSALSKAKERAEGPERSRGAS